MLKRSILSYISYGIISLIPFLIGVYVLLEKKMITGSSLMPGGIKELESPANIVIAISFFLFSALILLAFMEYKHKKIICEMTFFAALIILIMGSFL